MEIINTAQVNKFKMLIGEFDGRLLEKNRTALPKKFRDEFDSIEIIISRGYEGCLIILDTRKWNKLKSNIESKPFLNLDLRDTKRFIFGGAYEITLDRQGRFVVPDPLKEYACLTEDIKFVGIDDWIEVWDKSIWDDKLERLKKSASEIADRLNEK